MSYVRKKGVVSIYLIGLTWLGCALLRPLHRPSHYLAAALASVLAYYVGQIFFPDGGEAVEEPSAPIRQKPSAGTGTEEIDRLLAERKRAMSEMRRLNDSIRDEKISLQISHLELTTGKILDAVVEQPAKLPQIRRFLQYYLPTTLKLLHAYDRMDAIGGEGENIGGTRERIATILSSVCAAYDRQLDALYGEEALDISTDITVLENLLAQEGLQEDGESGTTLTL